MAFIKQIKLKFHDPLTESQREFYKADKRVAVEDDKTLVFLRPKDYNPIIDSTFSVSFGDCRYNFRSVCISDIYVSMG